MNGRGKRRLQNGGRFSNDGICGGNVCVKRRLQNGGRFSAQNDLVLR